ncbi:MAG: methyltransferase domain-containing protein [Legionellales bacterium]|nr:methyltransferase domain-containing protein [Legionellales bacterium]
MKLSTVSKFIFILLSLCLANGYAVSAKKNTYALSTGKQDLKRMRYLNEAVNPYSLNFIKNYIKKGDKVLDIGCGPGIMSQEIAKIVGEGGGVLGVDISNRQIQLAKKLASQERLTNIKFQQGSATDLTKIEEKYDVVYVRFVLIHMRNPYEVAEQVKKVLKPGGYLLVEELQGNTTISSRPYDYRLELIKKIDALQEEIQKTDFSIARTYGKFLSKNGYKVVANKTTHPKLDTLNKRRNFSLGMRSLEHTLLENHKISKMKLHSMIKRVEKLEENVKIELHFYKMGQIAAVLT